MAGTLQYRDEKQRNAKIPTGDFELMAEKLTILATSKTPPIYLDDEAEIQDDLHASRFLDLRRPRMQANLRPSSSNNQRHPS